MNSRRSARERIIQFVQGCLLHTVALGLFAQLANAQVGSSPIRSDDFHDTCSLASGPVKNVCATLAHLGQEDQGEEESGIFGLESSDSSSTKALEVIADLLTRRNYDAVAVNLAIVGSLDRSGAAYRYCAALAKKGLPPGEVAVSCIRPTCLVSKQFRSIAPYCLPLREDDHRSDVLAKVYEVIESDKGRDFGCTSADTANERPVCVGAEAAAIVVKVDQMLPLFSGIQARKLPVSCGKGATKIDACVSALAQLLQALGETWTTGGVISEGLRLWSELAAEIDPRRTFRDAWGRVEKSIPTAKDLERATAVTFPFDVDFVTALIDAQEAVKSAEGRVSEGLRREILEQFDAGKTLAAALGKRELPADFRKTLGPCAAEMAEWAQKTIDPQQADEVLRLGKFIETRSACKAQVENALHAFVQSASIGNIETTQSCNGGTSVTRIEQGLADYCFKVEPKTPGIVGFRLKFRPCLDLPDVECTTVGHLSLLIRAVADPQPLVVDYPLGVKDIQARVSDKTVTVLSVPPQVAYSPPDPRLIREALQRLLPPSFQVTNVGNTTLSQELNLTIKGIQIEAAGIRLPLLCIILSPSAASFGAEPNCDDLQNTAGALASLARDTLSKQLRQRAVALRDLPVPLNAVRVLRNEGDKCPADGIALGDMAIAPLEQTLALCGTADLALPNGPPVPVAVLWQNVGANAQRWRLILDDAKTRSALRDILPNGVNVETISSTDAKIVARVTASGGCRHTLELEVTRNGVKANVGQVATELAACALADANLPRLPESFVLFGITFSAQGGGRACAPIGGSPVCIANVRFNANRLNLEKAVLDDDGRLARYLQDKLDSLLPGGTVTVREVLPKLKADVAIPALEAIEFEMDAAVEGLERAATDAFRSAVAKAVVGQEISAGPFAVVARSLVPTNDVQRLALNVEIEYGSNKVETILEVLPKLKLQTPSLAGTIAQAIKGIFSGIDLPNTKLYVITTPDGLPVIRCEVALPMIAEALKAKGTIEWRPGKSNQPSFNGPVTLTWAGYTPIFAGVDIGNVSGQFDYNAPGNVSLSATLALTKGETTSNVLRLTGTLSYDKQANRITADTGLFVANGRLAKSTTVVDLGNASVESQLAPEGFAAYLPLPRSKVGIYGTACMASGKATIKLFNSVELADVAAVIVLPRCASDTSLQLAKLAELDSSDCRQATRSGLLCVAARMNVISLFRGHGVVKTPLGSFSPVLNISGEALGAQLGINASLKRIKVKADIKILSVTIIFPSAAGIDAKLIEKILANLLKPSIDLESVLKGKIVISANQGKGGGEGESESKKNNEHEDEAENKQNNNADSEDHSDQGEPKESGKPPVGTSDQRRTQIGSKPTARIAFSSGGSQIRISDDRRLMRDDWPYRVAVIDAAGNRAGPHREVRVTEETAAAILGRGQRALYVVPHASAFELSDGFFLLFCSSSPCQPGSFVARRVEVIGTDSPQGDLEKTVRLNVTSGELSELSIQAFAGALPRAAQLTLAEGKATELLCADLELNDCEVALHRIQGAPVWKYFRLGQPSEDDVAAESLWGRALNLLGQAAGTLIARTGNVDVTAFGISEDSQRIRALLSPTFRFGNAFGAIRSGTGTADVSRSVSLLTVDRQLERGYMAEPVVSSAEPARTVAPWETPAPDSPLNRIVTALPPHNAARKLTINTDPLQRRAIAEVVTEDGRSFLFSARQRGAVCKPVMQTSSQLTTTLNVWAQTADFAPGADARKGRLVRGTDVAALSETLVSRLVAEPFREPFLTDPLFLFYMNGNCP